MGNEEGGTPVSGMKKEVFQCLSGERRRYSSVLVGNEEGGTPVSKWGMKNEVLQCLSGE